MKLSLTKAELADPMYGQQPLSLLPPRLEQVGKRQERTGMVLEQNGTARFRIYAPQAARVTVILRISRQTQVRLELTRGADGIFEGTLPYEESYAGAQPVQLQVDGVDTLSPWLPIGWSGDRPTNYVELPERDRDYLQDQGLPHGTVTSVRYDSKVMGRQLRCLVYAPPGYMKSSESYPVLYLLHGGTENELAWVSSYQLPRILDRLIALGRAKPCLVVLNNGMIRFPGHEQVTWDDALEQVLLQDCIPMIESQFRVKTGKWNRAIAGLSMGSYMTNDIGLGHPERFGYMGQFTGCMYHETDRPNYDRPYPKVMEAYSADPQRFAEQYRVFFRSTTPLEDHFDYFEADDRICRQAGIADLPCYHRVVYSPTTSKCSSWRQGLRDFVQLIFKSVPAERE